MRYTLKGHDKNYIVETMVQIFYPVSSAVSLDFVLESGYVRRYPRRIHGETVYASIIKNGETIDTEEIRLNASSEMDRAIKLTIFNLLKKFTGENTPWGMLTGIRPIKIVRTLRQSGLTDEEVKEKLQTYYYINEKKSDLAIEICKNQEEILGCASPSHTSLYIGIPFCPSRCLYCSFTSFAMNKAKSEQYLEALYKEIDSCKSLKDIQTIYIGGGTPTALSAYQLEVLLDKITNVFDMRQLKEFTVEAGRPDTIDQEKLSVLKKYGVNRLTINPQTMNERTLSLIGRKHSVSEFIRAYNLARDNNFNNINVDLILGLTGENSIDIENTMEKIIPLNPENITIHTMAIKRASRLKEEMGKYNFLEVDEIEKMQNIVSKYLKDYKPYYLYRIKNTLGNMDNIGYGKDIFSIYNIHTMEDTQDIFALGAGGVSKCIDVRTDKITRVYNVKDVDEYINRIDEMINRKKELIEWKNQL